MWKKQKNELDKCSPTKIKVIGIDFLKWINIGLRDYLLGFRDRGYALENIVYIELLRRGFDVSIGKIDQLEVDFFTTKANEKLYIQVTETMKNESVRERELKPLQKIQNNHKK